MTRIHLHLDHLVLRGFSESQKPAVVEALRQELTQRLGSSPIPTDRPHEPSVSRSMAVGGGETPAGIGRKAGREVANIVRTGGGARA